MNSRRCWTGSNKCTRLLNNKKGHVIARDLGNMPCWNTGSSDGDATASMFSFEIESVSVLVCVLHCSPRWLRPTAHFHTRVARYAMQSWSLGRGGEESGADRILENKTKLQELELRPSMWPLCLVIGGKWVPWIMLITNKPSQIVTTRSLDNHRKVLWVWLSVKESTVTF